MTTVAVHAILNRDVLVARETARELRPAIEAAVAPHPKDIDLDLSAIQVLGPSFFDELVGILSQHLRQKSGLQSVRIRHSPTDLDAFGMIAKTYDLVISQRGKGDWQLQRRRRMRGSS